MLTRTTMMMADSMDDAEMNDSDEINHTTNNADGQKNAVVAPMYITIGPQGCGKTTLLKEIPGLVDISLDDQPDVYVPVPTSYFMALASVASASTSKTNNSFVDFQQSNTYNRSSLEEYEIHGKTIHQRITESPIHQELALILQRWTRQISPQNFAVALLQHYQEQNHPTEVGHALIHTVEAFLNHTSSSLPVPDVLQFFVVESLFRPNPFNNQSAIERAHRLLLTTPAHVPIAWGNTNSKPSDFQRALDIAHQTKRPVFFVTCRPNNNGATPAGPLPWLSLPTLLCRNLQRFATTGKYIPATAISECSGRIEALFSSCSSEQQLVELASPPQKPFRYQLTQNRLIHKQYFTPRKRQPQHQYQQQQQQQQQAQSNRPKRMKTSGTFGGNNNNPNQENGQANANKRKSPPRPSASHGMMMHENHLSSFHNSNDVPFWWCVMDG